MTILIILAGLLISHFATAMGQWRQFDWLLWPVRRLREQFPQFPWLLPVAVVAIAFVLALVAVWIMTALLGLFGWALLALATFLYTLGPRDLDRDVETILAEPEHADAREAAEVLGFDAEQSPGENAAAVLQGARARWFSVLFWFVLLGIPGALMYRLAQKALQMPELGFAEQEWLGRLRWVLDWPVLALMLVSLGLGADLDRTWQAWRNHHRERPYWLLSPLTLTEVTADLVDSELSGREGFRRGHQLAWRMLVLWLVVMSVMLLAGWLV